MFSILFWCDELTSKYYWNHIQNKWHVELRASVTMLGWKWLSFWEALCYWPATSVKKEALPQEIWTISIQKWQHQPSIPGKPFILFLFPVHTQVLCIIIAKINVNKDITSWNVSAILVAFVLWVCHLVCVVWFWITWWKQEGLHKYCVILIIIFIWLHYTHKWMKTAKLVRNNFITYKINMTFRPQCRTLSGVPWIWSIINNVHILPNSSISISQIMMLCKYILCKIFKACLDTMNIADRARLDSWINDVVEDKKLHTDFLPVMNHWLKQTLECLAPMFKLISSDPKSEALMQLSQSVRFPLLKTWDTRWIHS